MQVILDSSFARPGSAPIWGGKKGEFRDWTIQIVTRTKLCSTAECLKCISSDSFEPKTGKVFRTCTNLT